MNGQIKQRIKWYIPIFTLLTMNYTFISYHFLAMPVLPEFAFFTIRVNGYIFIDIIIYLYIFLSSINLIFYIEMMNFKKTSDEIEKEIINKYFKKEEESIKKYMIKKTK